MPRVLLTHQDLSPELDDVGERRDDLGQPEQAADEVCMRPRQTDTSVGQCRELVTVVEERLC